MKKKFDRVKFKSAIEVSVRIKGKLLVHLDDFTGYLTSTPTQILMKKKLIPLGLNLKQTYINANTSKIKKPVWKYEELANGTTFSDIVFENLVC